ncbi:hypothetical protein [Umezakia ovalisporum]|uniref:Uncharacterized protein n=1 Tax=Umezakia ovalisporum FSS-43 TaxID=2740520 RepID=A0ABT6K2H8_9CYAN|nr:hypothetical protein [Umezakia ovalisporum]MDH6056498.1 hypothetical protein [Umezakia ovalisporum FSS-43]
MPQTRLSPHLWSALNRVFKRKATAFNTSPYTITSSEDNQIDDFPVRFI